MTDFSHLRALEERAVRIRERMIDVQKNDAQWKAQAVQLFQTEKEIADEREFLGLEDMDVDKLYAALSPEAEYDLPICESCGKTLTIRDTIATDGQSLLCFKCELLERCDACEHFHEMNETCGKCGKRWSGDVGKAYTSSLEAQLAQAEDACKQIQTDYSFQLASTQKALKGLYNAVQKSRSANDPLGMEAAMDEAGRWF